MLRELFDQYFVSLLLVEDVYKEVREAVGSYLETETLPSYGFSNVRHSTISQAMCFMVYGLELPFDRLPLFISAGNNVLRDVVRWRLQHGYL